MENCLIFQRATLISEWMAWVFRCVPKKFPMPKFVHSNKSATDSEASRWSRSSPNARDWIFNNIEPFWCDRFRADCYPFGIRSSVTFSLAPYSIYHSAIGYIFRLLCLCVQFFCCCYSFNILKIVLDFHVLISTFRFSIQWFVRSTAQCFRIKFGGQCKRFHCKRILRTHTITYNVCACHKFRSCSNRHNELLLLLTKKFI